MTVISDEAYKELRRILQKQNRRTYSLEEVKVIGDELLGFYMLLVNIENRIGKEIAGDD